MLIQKDFIDFCLPAVMPNGDIKNLVLSEYFDGLYGILFFYPLDFTFVCPTELLALNQSMKEFHARDAAVVAISVDSQFTHSAYRKIPIVEGGIGKLDLPMVSDLTKEISRKYNVLLDESVALRATIIIDKKGKIRAQHVNDLPIGRNIEEILRIIDAIDYNAVHGEVCPANWKKGEQAITTTQDSVKQYLSKKMQKAKPE